jgi:hypothetical protein
MSSATLQIKFTPKRMPDKKEAALNCASQNSEIVCSLRLSMEAKSWDGVRG